MSSLVRGSKAKGSKRRLDVELVERGLVNSRAEAQRLILAGEVLVNNEPWSKAGASVSSEAEIRLRSERSVYVSRGAHKLEKALMEFQISVVGKHCLDIGASTGGFTQVLLMNGARDVVAVDVGHNQLDWKNRSVS